MRLKNNQGFTLIEVLASFVIITILVVSFSLFFSQNASTASYNNEKLVVTNLADAMLVNLQQLTFTKAAAHTSNSTYDLQQYFQDASQPSPTLKKPPTAIVMNGKTYTITYRAVQNQTKQTSVGFSEKDLNLITVVVTVTSPDGKTKSSTEGFVHLE